MLNNSVVTTHKNLVSIATNDAVSHTTIHTVYHRYIDDIDL